MLDWGFKGIGMFGFKGGKKSASDPAGVVRVQAAEADGRDTEAKFHGPVSVLETLLDNAVEIPTSCGGMGTCGTCRIVIVESRGEVEERNEIELEMAEARCFSAEERLACQVQAQDGLKVRVLQED